MINSTEEFAALRLSDSHADQLRAGTEEASLDVWLDVIRRFPELREWVARNKTVPIQILEQLAVDPKASVRCAVADKRKLTPTLRGNLAMDKEPSVRARIAYNAKCEIELLHVLAADPEAIVSQAAVSRLLARTHAG